MAEEGESPAASLAEVTWRGLGAVPLGPSLGRSGAERSVTEGAPGREKLLADERPPGRVWLARRVPKGGSERRRPC